MRGEIGPCEQPRNDRVRIPHLAGAQLVTTPDHHRHRRDHIEESPGRPLIRAQPLGTPDRIPGVRYDTVCPAAHLVAKHPKSRDPSVVDRTLHNHAARSRIAVRTRPCVLDGEAAFRQVDFERGVVEGERSSLLGSGLDGLVNASVHPNEADATRTKRNPKQVDADGGEPGGGTRFDSHPASVRPEALPEERGSASLGAGVQVGTFVCRATILPTSIRNLVVI